MPTEKRLTLAREQISNQLSAFSYQLSVISVRLADS